MSWNSGEIHKKYQELGNLWKQFLCQKNKEISTEIKYNASKKISTAAVYEFINTTLCSTL